jgi:hypothetical protein
MLVTFRTKANADITMFGDVAVELLKLGGMTGNVPTAILAADIPAFLGQLSQGLEERSGAREPPVSAENAPPGEEEEAEAAVPLRTRALPLIGLLRSAQQAGADVIVSVSR